MFSLDDLNSRQREAVEAVDGPVAVLAGPGTGKTRTLVYRIAHLIQNRRVSPANILALTFTRSAAGEMKERIEELLAGSARNLGDLWVGTYHAAALNMLREQGYPFGSETGFSVATEQDKEALLEGLAPQDVRALLEEARREKQRLRLPASGPCAQYQGRLAERGLLDFDDLLLYACRLLDERPEVLKDSRARLRYVLVDEFQDTSFAQYEFLRRLAGSNACVIGDPDQAIYGFAGEPFRPFQRFQQDRPDCRLLPLRENYRSQAVILDAAMQVIGKNDAELPRELRARLERGLPIEISAHQTERQEAEMIVRRIEGLLGGSSYFTIDSRWAEKERESYAYGLGDIAVLYRFHAQARRIEDALTGAGIPCRVFGKKLRQNGEIREEDDLEDFLTSEQSAPRAFKPRGEWVSLMTMHRSKGLEFPVVFLAGCHRGALPYLRGEDDDERRAELEEERRLFYVGMTRAKNRLFVSYAKRAFLFGRELEGGASSFLSDIEERLRVLQEGRVAAKKPKAVQRALFKL